MVSQIPYLQYRWKLFVAKTNWFDETITDTNNSFTELDMSPNYDYITAGVLHYDNHQSAVSTVVPIAGPATNEGSAGSGRYCQPLAYMYFY